MSIYVSDSIYLGGYGPDINANNPIIGWHSILQPNDIIADEFVSGRPAINMWNPDTSSVWEGVSVSGSPTVSTTQYINLINASNQVFDYVAIARHNFGDIGLSYTLQHSIDGVTWENLTDPRIIGSNDPIMDVFGNHVSGQVRIRLQKTLVGSPATIPSPIIAHIKMGKSLILQRRIYVGHRPASIAKQVKKTVNGSESGQYLGTIVTRSYRTSSISQENNSPAFVRTFIKPFINHVNGHLVENNTAPCTFFFAWRPADYPSEIVYGWTNDNIIPENQGSDSMGGRMKWSFDMECIA